MTPKETEQLREIVRLRKEIESLKTEIVKLNNDIETIGQTNKIDKEIVNSLRKWIWENLKMYSAPIG